MVNYYISIGSCIVVSIGSCIVAYSYLRKLIKTIIAASLATTPQREKSAVIPNIQHNIVLIV